MIFAKDDNHATEIVDIAKNVFKPEFENDAIPEKFVQKITYSVGDSNALIRDLRTEKDFRIAVTVTLVATGTDVEFVRYGMLTVVPFPFKYLRE